RVTLVLNQSSLALQPLQVAAGAGEITGPQVVVVRDVERQEEASHVPSTLGERDELQRRTVTGVGDTERLRREEAHTEQLRAERVILDQPREVLATFEGIQCRTPPKASRVEHGESKIDQSDAGRVTCVRVSFERSQAGEDARLTRINLPHPPVAEGDPAERQ